ncbi:MAG: BrnT family toxin [Pseudomonadota bacterium]
MKIEWDETKRRQTLSERGVDFADVNKLDWATALTREDSRSDYGERRFVTIGYILDRLHVLAWTKRGDVFRVISLRKANKRESTRYDKA